MAYSDIKISDIFRLQLTDLIIELFQRNFNYKIKIWMMSQYYYNYI